MTSVKVGSIADMTGSIRVDTEGVTEVLKAVLPHLSTNREDKLAYFGPCIVDLMGHTQLVGYGKEVRLFGQTLLELNLYDINGELPGLKRYFTPGAIYGLMSIEEGTIRYNVGYHNRQAFESAGVPFGTEAEVESPVEETPQYPEGMELITGLVYDIAENGGTITFGRTWNTPDHDVEMWTLRYSDSNHCHIDVSDAEITLEEVLRVFKRELVRKGILADAPADEDFGDFGPEDIPF